MGVVPGTGHVHSYSESSSRGKFSSSLKYFKNFKACDYPAYRFYCCVKRYRCASAPDPSYHRSLPQPAAARPVAPHFASAVPALPDA